jgi:hypothetical protein
MVPLCFQPAPIATVKLVLKKTAIKHQWDAVVWHLDDDITSRLRRSLGHKLIRRYLGPNKKLLKTENKTVEFIDKFLENTNEKLRWSDVLSRLRLALATELAIPPSWTQQNC